MLLSRLVACLRVAWVGSATLEYGPTWRLGACSHQVAGSRHCWNLPECTSTGRRQRRLLHLQTRSPPARSPTRSQGPNKGRPSRFRKLRETSVSLRYPLSTARLHGHCQCGSLSANRPRRHPMTRVRANRRRMPPSLRGCGGAVPRARARSSHGRGPPWSAAHSPRRCGGAGPDGRPPLSPAGLPRDCRGQLTQQSTHGSGRLARLHEGYK